MRSHAALTSLRRLLLLCCLCLSACSGARAGNLHYCDQPAPLSAEQKDQLFRFSAVIKSTLDASGSSLALIARSGLDLQRFGVRYSHAGLSLKAGMDTPWSVRQLYFACDERRPRVFDQGMSGFLLGLDRPADGYISVVLLPAAAAADLQRALLDKHQALQLLAANYSANAYPFSERYQNCNQWVVEMLASAWARLSDGTFGERSTAAPEAKPSRGSADAEGAGLSTRAAAQRWLQQQGYQPTLFEVSFPPLQWLGGLIPWLHNDDHPPEDIARQWLRTSMPASIEAFVRATVPGAVRLEFCHHDKRVVIHHGWEPIAEGCQPAASDTVIALD